MSDYEAAGRTLAELTRAIEGIVTTRGLTEMSYRADDRGDRVTVVVELRGPHVTSHPEATASPPSMPSGGLRPAGWSR